MKQILTTALSSKRIQGILLMVLVHFFPNINIDIANVTDVNTLAQLWTAYGLLSAKGSALPNLGDIKGLFKK